MTLMAAVGCDPYVETSPGLPAPPSAEVHWYFLPDTVDGVVGIDDLLLMLIYYGMVCV